jgi:hypothetical protein
MDYVCSLVPTMTSRRSESSEGGDRRKRKAVELGVKLRGECYDEKC